MSFPCRFCNGERRPHCSAIGRRPVLRPLLRRFRRPPARQCELTSKPGRHSCAYALHGIEHILTGYDHLLFITALVLAAGSFWDLVKVVTAFTLAHTITLTLSVLNIVTLRSAIVEPMIAASIICVAVQNIFWPERSSGWHGWRSPSASACFTASALPAG